MDVLSLQLLDVLTKLPDRALSGKLRRVYQAAARAIAHLSDMDLIQYETALGDSAPDLSLWEEMAPVIRDTVMDVNALLNAIREQFPEQPVGGIADTLSQVIEEVGRVGGGHERRAAEAQKVLHDISRHLSQEITHLGERMRSPQVVSDRWSLLADVQSFRSRFRELMGDLVYSTASAFADVGRKDVVPGYKEELACAILIRSNVVDLARLVGSRVDKLGTAEPEDVQWYAQQLGKDLDVFGKTPAYRALRAQDKRQIIEFRHAVGQVAAKNSAAREELLALAKPFAEFVASLDRVNNREVLIAHDREVWAACGVHLEQADLLQSEKDAAAALASAVSVAQDLYGREPELDGFLRKAKKSPVDGLTGDELRQEISRFRELLSNIPMM